MIKPLHKIILKKVKTIISDRLNYYHKRMKRILLSIEATFIKEQKINYEGVEIAVNISTKGDLCRAKGEYEKFVVDQIYNSLHTSINSEVVYYEIGGCTGINSLIVSKLIRDKKGMCIIFEPSPADIKTIAINILKNDIKNIVIIPFAISNVNNLGKLYLDKPYISSGQGGHSLRFLDFMNKNRYINIPCMKLDDVIKTFKLPVPSFVSLDVEGNELKVLEGMERVLSSPKLTNIIVEVMGTRNPYQSTVSDLVKKSNYRVKDYKPASLRQRETCMVNYQKTA